MNQRDWTRADNYIENDFLQLQLFAAFGLLDTVKPRCDISSSKSIVAFSRRGADTASTTILPVSVAIILHSITRIVRFC